VKQIKINNELTIGKDNPIFIIAEIGVTCNYNLEISKKLIDVSKESGADAIKFVIHFPYDLYSNKDEYYTYDTVNGKVTENMYDMFDLLRFTSDEWKEMKDYADSVGILMFASVEGEKGIDIGKDLNFLTYKIGAWDLNDLPFLEEMSKLDKSIMIDVGTVHRKELEVVLDIFKNNDVILLHEYHTDNFSEMNLKSIEYINDNYDVVVGFSSPNSYDVNDYASVAMGAKVLEKRLTIKKDLEGHHHIISKEPEAFKEWVKNIRNLEKAIGSYDIIPSSDDLKQRSVWFKHICAEVDIPKGTIISEDMMACKRPAIAGLAPKHWDSLIGKKLNKDIKRNEAITLKNTMEVYGIGLPRTGTTSLSFALEILGLDSHHHCVINNSDNESNSTIMVNNGFYKNYRELFTNNLDSKFILTVRNPQEWETSMSSKQHLIEGKVPNITEYNSEIIRFFEENDGNLLILNIFEENNKDIWSKLCNFLDVKTPKLNFPHEIKK
jgi:sialic acid synthase SpsE